MIDAAMDKIRQFQSTLPMRGGTFNQMHYDAGRRISIHPPHAGRDFGGSQSSGGPTYFNPPSPCGEGLIEVFYCFFR